VTTPRKDLLRPPGMGKPLGTSARIAGGSERLKDTRDNRDPKELGEQLLEAKRRYRYKKLSTAYDRRIDG
jgi:hypothetical protein